MACMNIWRSGFDKVKTNDVDNNFFRVIKAGSGMTVNQSSGSLVIASGTTAYSETIIRSQKAFDGSFVARYSALLSQRIANHTSYVEWVDVIGDNLAMTINSATSVTVTIPNMAETKLFTSDNVGQGISIGAITVASALSQRGTIASVTGNDVTITVSGFPSSGTGTCSLFGWNYHRVAYSGTTATNALYDTQRNGWNSTDTTATINTTASTHVGILSSSEGEASFGDSPSSSATGIERTQRASRIRNVPDTCVDLYCQIRVLNGSTSPASTTSLTIGFVDVFSIEDVDSVSLLNISPMSASSGLMAEIINTPNIGTVSTVSSSTPVAPTSQTVTAAASTNATSVKASAGTVWSVVVNNTTAASKFAKFYNKASAPTVGTDIPVMTITCPANSTVNIHGGANGIRFATGIALAITGAVADTDTTATAANDAKLIVSYT